MTGDELRTWRHEQGLTQTQLAERLDRERTTIYLWETGKRTIPSWLPLALRSIEQDLANEKRRRPEG